MYPHQAERLTEVLEREGLAALVASSADNVAYVTGFRSPAHALFRAPRFAAFTPRGSALVVPAADAPVAVVDGAGAGHVFAFGDPAGHFGAGGGPDVAQLRAIIDRVAATPGDALGLALDALGVSFGSIGLDETGLTSTAWRPVADRLAPRGLVRPAADLLLAARRAKGPYELECLQRALNMAEEALNTVLQTLKPGVTEREALAAWQAEVLRLGASPLPGSIATGPRTWIPAAPATDRALRAREVVRFDLRCVFKGYCASLGRTAVMGDPDDRQQRAYDAVTAGLEAALAAIRPGATAAQVHAAVVDAARAAGHPGLGGGRVGHGIGLAAWEPPDLGPRSDTALEMGEVLCVQVPWLEAGWAGLAATETVLVTRVGSHALNRSVRGLVVLD